ncbi:MAG: LysM peptidoglycan-binding domain-containing protein [Deltaproteobacteria bacterium]|nr:LysM peptidoglycan-binding domain-containing protein [Deltaproteobacteria bacterium]
MNFTKNGESTRRIAIFNKNHSLRTRLNIWFISIFLGLALCSISTADSGNKIQRKIIIVKRGDTLAKICRQEYGKYSNELLKMIMENNPEVTDPNLIFVGEQIVIPNITPGPQAPQTLPPAFRPEPKPLKPKENAPEYSLYPSPMPGEITQLTWLNDNQAIVEGRVTTSARYRFFIYVPGDTEYEQPELQMLDAHHFKVLTTIGRRGRDYGQEFVLKLSLYDTQDNRIGEIRESVQRTQHQSLDIIPMLKKKGARIFAPRPTGWNGLENWVKLQTLDATSLDNNYFRIANGTVVPNFRYLSFSPDERYLSWYGRITLYGTSCLAKALLIKGEIEQAESLLRVWAKQVDKTGKIPRSANVVGDNYISPDVRSGEVIHFLGALGLAKKINPSSEWDDPIEKIIKGYIKPLMDPKLGIISGGYDGKDSNGYAKPRSYEKISWFSAEHNFDLYQALNVLIKIDNLNPELKNDCLMTISLLNKNIEKFFWNKETNTFNRGWRPQSGPDCSQALDCSSWGALYLLKRARLAGIKQDNATKEEYLNKALLCLNYADSHFRSKWNYQTPEGDRGSITGYRPYAGKIDDLKWEDGTREDETIEWDSLNNMVWSEGTLGVAMAWHEYGLQKKDNKALQKAHSIYQQMKDLQALSDQGGLLYSTTPIKGHFTIGEELASLSWLGYLALNHDLSTSIPRPELLDWAPW